MAKEKEYCILGKETKYFKTYVKATSEKNARVKAREYHIDDTNDFRSKDITHCHLIDEGAFYKDEFCYIPKEVTYDVREKDNG